MLQFFLLVERDGTAHLVELIPSIPHELTLAKTTIMKFDFDAVLKLITFPEMIAAGDLLFLPFPNAFEHLMHCKNT